MAKKTKQLPTIHDSLKEFADTIEKSAYRRGQLAEKIRLGNYINERLEQRIGSTERNLLNKLADVVLDEN
jgi:hypothetical protein